MSAVPCNGCTRCCRGDAVRLLAEDYNAAGRPRFHSVPHAVVPGASMLAHQANGDCVYLDRAVGCTIHSDKPAMCRAMDCRVVARLTWTQARRMGVIPIWRRGRELTAAPADPPREDSV